MTLHLFMFPLSACAFECMSARASSTLIASPSNPEFISGSLRWERHTDVSHLAGQPKPLYFHCHWNPFGEGGDLFGLSYLCSPVRNHITGLVYLFSPWGQSESKGPNHPDTWKFFCNVCRKILRKLLYSRHTSFVSSKSQSLKSEILRGKQGG